jgi:hypothetical protein
VGFIRASVEFVGDIGWVIKRVTRAVLSFPWAVTWSVVNGFRFRYRDQLWPLVILALLALARLFADGSPPVSVLMLATVAAGVSIFHVRAKLDRQREWVYAGTCAVCMVAGLTWMALGVHRGLLNALSVLVGFALAACWWGHHEIRDGERESLSTVVGRWNKYIRGPLDPEEAKGWKGGPMAGAEMTGPIPFEHGGSYTIRIVPYLQTLAKAQADLLNWTSALDIAMENMILEKHPDYPKSERTLRLQHITTSPIENTIWFDCPRVEDGRVLLGPYADGIGEAFLRLYTENSMWSSFILGGTGSGKALDVDTPIATPSGWATMGSLRVGDEVLDEHRTPTLIIATSDVMAGRPCYELEFSDGSHIVADRDHQWEVWFPHQRRRAVLTTEQVRIALARRSGSAQRGVRLSASDPRLITQVTRVITRPVRCIQVASASCLYLAGKTLIPTHNSRMLEQIAIAVLSMGNTIVFYMDGQNGASSPTLFKYADWAVGIDGAPDMLTALEQCARWRQMENRAYGWEGFTPSPERPGILVIIDEQHAIAPLFAYRLANAVNEWRKLGQSVIGADQDSSLGAAFAGEDRMRSGMCGGSSFAMRVKSRIAGILLPGLEINPADLPLMPGYAVMVAAEGSGGRTAGFRNRYAPNDQEKAKAIARGESVPVPTIAEWFERFPNPVMDVGSAKAMGPAYLNRRAQAEVEREALLRFVRGEDVPSPLGTPPGASAAPGSQQGGGFSGFDVYNAPTEQQRMTCADRIKQLNIDWSGNSSEVTFGYVFKKLKKEYPEYETKQSTVRKALDKLADPANPDRWLVKDTENLIYSRFDPDRDLVSTG